MASQKQAKKESGKHPHPHLYPYPQQKTEVVNVGEYTPPLNVPATHPLDACAEAVVPAVSDELPSVRPSVLSSHTPSPLSSPSTVLSVVESVSGEDMAVVEGVSVVEINHPLVDLQGLERRLNDRQSAIRSHKSQCYPRCPSQ